MIQERVVKRTIVGLLVALSLAGRTSAQLAPIPQDEGATGLLLALRRLDSTARILYVTAHPDDENNPVLVRLSRGFGHRTALLTLTRGEGGQNEIGPQLFEALGVLRSEELLAVHRYDGVEQYFARAFEFGFSYSLEETFQKWGHDETLGDVVRVVRAFRPDVILTLSLESPDHQHHAAAARLAQEAFRAAADKDRYPEQIAQGLRPWQARKIYQGAVGGALKSSGTGPVVVLDTGVYDPLLGMTWLELGSLSRSFHRCQGASQLQASPGPAEASYRLVDSDPPAAPEEKDILDGIDWSWAGLVRFAATEPARAPFLAAELLGVEAQVRGARAAFTASAPERTVPFLASGLDRTRRLRARIETSRLSEAPRAELAARLLQKEREFEDALPLAQGLVLQVAADRPQVTRGQSFNVTATIFNQGTTPARLDGFTLSVPAGWSAERPKVALGFLASRRSVEARFSVKVAADARYSQPYWSRSGPRDRYDVVLPADESLPFAPPDVMASVQYVLDGVAARIERPAIWRYPGASGGEKQKVVSVVPALSVATSPGIVVLPLASAAHRDVRVTVTNGLRGAADADVRLEVPAGFSVDPAHAPLHFGFEGEEATLRFALTAPAGRPQGDVEARAVATSGGVEYREGFEVIAYDHIQERHLFHPAATRVKSLDVAVDKAASVGYVAGVADDVPVALAELGVPVTLLSAKALAEDDLSQYTTIVTGVRAYKARPELKTNHGRLMRYVEEGGNLVVQYNRSEFNQAGPISATEAAPATSKADSPFAPFPAITTADRITDETAPVELLVPDDPVFKTPNRIGPRDFEGWVQERGVAFLEARDPRYVALVSMTDPFPLNAGEKKGALVEAHVGKGTWTYVALGLYRQVQAGTSGAYRLLANLVSRPRGR